MKLTKEYLKKLIKEEISVLKKNKKVNKTKKVNLQELKNLIKKTLKEDRRFSQSLPYEYIPEKNVIEFEYEDLDDDQNIDEIPVYTLPAKKEVCPACEGEGKYVNPNIDYNGITSSEMEELGDDFREDYMSGKYDITCHLCKGKCVIPVPNYEYKQTSKYKKAFEKFDKLKKEHDEFNSELEYERRLRDRGIEF